ncbi:hypothetical protein [Caldivirga maquilingensis]|uniref:Fucose isomerase n=1 Tax=Caldivirga maquilingensis (strain ATCC 700844 / DSM 13496 / JCM 10307 / IC-167) TaxID=397948 RepID=A8MCH5_CALMQ|nr:hypothetical protein [Caldivirga maquilingensis]ABW01481.1 hypothetical protein Cmaq_0641 [Caldivirga maquilingensis IC-167]
MVKLPVVFLEPPLGAVGYPGGPSFKYLQGNAPSEVSSWFETFWKWASDFESRVLNRLKSLYPDVEFTPYYARSIDDLEDALTRESESVGFIVIDLQGPSSMVQRIVATGKPVVFIAESLGGGGDYLLYNRLLEQYPVLGIVTRSVDSNEALSLVKYLIALTMLKNTHAVVISNRDLSNWLSSISRNTGVKFTLISGGEFVDKYYSRVNADEAKPIAETWVKEASHYPDPDKQWPEVLKSARLYIAVNRLLEDYKANAVTIDCLGLRSASAVVLDAWPCLTWMQLWLNGKYVPMCEADANSLIAALIGKYLLNTAGSATDPVTDELTGEVTYYHCYLPINPKPGIRLRYSIIPSHLGTRYAAVNVEYPVGSDLTAVGIDAVNRIMHIHVSKVTGNELSLPACGTKVIAKANVKALSVKWGAGWHRVPLLGDHRDELKKMAKLMGFKVIEEDQ